jgi:TonB-dependent starch-binding outer membrane protein SusC
VITRHSTLAGLLLLLRAMPACAQTGTITGRVTDAQSGMPLDGVEVMVVGRNLAGLSRSDGRFLITSVPQGPSTLRAERIGYAPLERTAIVPAGAAIAVDFALTVRPFDFDEIVVTGTPSGARQREIGHTVTRLEVEELSAREVTLSDFLQGAAVGVEITGASGEAGQGKQIRLRGNRSMILTNQPLVYVDGVRMMDGAFPSTVFPSPNFAPFTPAGANVTTSPLDMVSLGDIDRIEVVKGPAASTLFGTGSANGVIQIFTRMGRPGAQTWIAEISQGTGWVRPFGANGVDYLHAENFLRESWWGDGYEGGMASGECVTDDARWEGANASPEGACRWPGTQWYQSYRLSTGGGWDAISYFVSGEYQNDRYALPLDRLERYALRTNLGAAPSSRAEIRFRAAYTDMTTANTISGNDLEGLLLSSMRGDRNVLGSGDPRVIALLLNNRNDQDIARFTSGLTATFAQTPTLSHRLTLGYDYSGQDLLSQRPVGGLLAAPGSTTTRTWRRRLGTMDYVASAVLSPGRDVRSTVSLGGQLVADDVDSFVEATSETSAPREIQTEGATTNVGVFAQNLFGFRDRYFVTLGVRMDRHATRGRSFLRADPVVSGAWAVSDEPFWRESWGALRLRSAYGRTRAAAGPFQQAVTFSGGFTPADSGAVPVLAPERISEWEIGLDGAVLAARLTFGFTYYRQTTDDALVSVTPDPSAPSPRRTELQNVGRTRNRGIELEVDGALVSTARWGLNLGIGLTTNQSTLLDLGGAQPFQDLNARLIVGQPVPVSVGRKVADPEAVNGAWNRNRYVLENGVPAFVPLGPHLPTHFLSPTLSARMPGGVRVQARGEYRGGNILFVNPADVSRGEVSALCLPYYVDPNAGPGRGLKPDAPDIWQERCTPSAALDYWFDADYFKLRSLAATIPVDFVFPSEVDEALLSVVLTNAYRWYRELPWWDFEILSNEGANDDGLGSSDRVPAPATVTFALRVRF